MPDHSIKYVRVTAHGTRDDKGRLEYIGAAQDVTQRRLSEESLTKARSGLARVTRVIGLGVLTASIAHEVKQPIGAIFTNAESSVRWLKRAKPDIEKALVLTSRVVADARRTCEIVDRIREMASQRAPVHKPLSLADVINNSLNFLRHELLLKGVVLSLDLTRDLPQVVGDRTQLQQVIVNLVVNAVQAMTQIAATDRSIYLRPSCPILRQWAALLMITAPGLIRSICRVCSTIFSRPKTPAWVWGWQSVGLLSRLMAVAFARTTIRPSAVPVSVLICPQPERYRRSLSKPLNSRSSSISYEARDWAVVRGCQIDFDVVDIAPAPSLRRVVALNNWMTGRFKVPPGMTIGRLVAAAEMPATAAEP